MPYELTRGDFLLSTEPKRLDLEGTFEFLSRSYWARHRPREVFLRAVEHSLCFGLYRGSRQIGFARVISDSATFAYLADVYVVELYRGRGLAKWMVSSVLAHPDLKTVRRWLLTTKDAHRLYRECGFSDLKEPEQQMQLLQPYPGELPTGSPVAVRFFGLTRRFQRRRKAGGDRFLGKT
jgi:GNAT superfamily N-acetyltransferase